MSDSLTREKIRDVTEPLRELCDRNGIQLFIYFMNVDLKEGSVSIQGMNDQEIVDMFKRVMDKMEISPTLMIRGGNRNQQKN